MYCIYYNIYARAETNDFAYIWIISVRKPFPWQIACLIDLRKERLQHVAYASFSACVYIYIIDLQRPIVDDIGHRLRTGTRSLAWRRAQAADRL